MEEAAIVCGGGCNRIATVCDASVRAHQLAMDRRRAPGCLSYLVITPHLRGGLAPAHGLVDGGGELGDQRERGLHAARPIVSIV